MADERSDKIEHERRDTAASVTQGHQAARTAPQYLIGFVAALTAAATGFGMVYSSSLIGNLESGDYSGPRIHLTESEQSWLGSIWGLSYCFGNLCAGFPLRIFGRKRVLIVGMLPFVGGWVCYALAENVAMLFAGRILTSWAGGFVTGPSQLYVSEISETHIRGKIGTFPQLLKTIGILASYTVGYFANFKILAWVSSVLPMIVCVGMLWMPMSPKWLVNQKRIKEAEESLRFLRGKHFDCSVELKAMQETQERAEKDKIGLAMFTKVQYLRPIIVANMLMVLYVLSGVNNVLFFANPIFESAGTNFSGSISAIIVGCVQFLGFLASTMITDKFGRRVLLLSSICVVSLSLIPLGFFFYLKANDHNVDGLGWLPIASIVVYIFAFSIGLGPLPFVIMGEILPTQVREIGSTVSVSFLSIFTFSNAKAMHPLFHAIGEHGTFWLYSAFCAGGFIYIWFGVPETKGRSLEQIENDLRRRSLF